MHRCPAMRERDREREEELTGVHGKVILRKSTSLHGGSHSRVYREESNI